MNRHILGRALLTLTLASAMLTFAFWNWYLEQSRQASGPWAGGVRQLVIDPGHGGEDGGAVSVDGVVESQINLAVALRCDQLAGLCGQPVLMLRTEDRSLAAQEGGSLRERKRSDLYRRVEIINQCEDPVVLSIHQNFFSGSIYAGAQVFYRPGEESAAWAKEMQEQLREGLDPQNDRMEKQIPEEIYLMSHISCPAILVECGFLSNPEECALLQQPDYQLKLAVILTGTSISWMKMQ